MKYCTLLAFCVPFLGPAQYFSLPEGQHSQKLKFELINNLMVIPLEVNGAKLSFILDSGVSKPILFNLSDQDSLELKNVSEIAIRGLGDGDPIQALSSRGNSFKMRNIRNEDQLLYVVLDKSINFSPSLGIAVHGIIGYEIFRDFVVEINYISKTLKFHDPEHYNPKNNRKHHTMPLNIQGKKAYIEGKVSFNEDEDVAVNMLLDTGSSDAIWLFQDSENGLAIPENNYDDFLGKGLNGNIFGKRTKVHQIKIGEFVLKDVKAAFPDMTTFSSANLGDRNGSIGGEILKRFNVVFNYPSGEITFKKNGNFNTPFHYNMSGIELQHSGVRYVAERIAAGTVETPTDENAFGNVQILMESRTRLSLVPEIIVSAIRAGSPAAEAGLQEGDVILAVNGKRIHRYKLQEVMKMLNEREGKRIRVLIERYNNDLIFTFVLQKLFK